MVAFLCLKHKIVFYHTGRYHKSSTLSVNGQDSLLSEVSYSILFWYLQCTKEYWLLSTLTLYYDYSFSI